MNLIWLWFGKSVKRYDMSSNNKILLAYNFFKIFINISPAKDTLSWNLNNIYTTCIMMINRWAALPTIVFLNKYYNSIIHLNITVRN